MAATVIDGNLIAAGLGEELRERIDRLGERGINPCLAVILVGEDPASLSYVRGKQAALRRIGLEGKDYRLPESASEAELISLIKTLNDDCTVHGILVQLPLPSHIRQETVITAIDPRKDVDCFHPLNLGKLMMDEPGFLPGTPQGVIVLLRKSGIPLAGSHAVVVGRSNIVGKPLAIILARHDVNVTVTLCHTGTRDLGAFTRQADILVAACGKPGLIRGDMIKPGAAVIDVGINRVEDAAAKKGYRLAGDVVFSEAAETAGWITPVPGGVGPLTIAMLLRNVVWAAEQYGA